ncbi:hypothetical protein NP233_g11791 [Leucocoprinus birnbaumii]|uniref:DUF6532 domain-containing protein n=1 Tax=Leucocoprinus birnbaumii TaxID=56174 RepID=A0AAD5VIB6_9AGAR|nr:hypothetical protein NP233_g11791 [Leucocoprinus birnbaumii]
MLIVWFLVSLENRKSKDNALETKVWLPVKKASAPRSTKKRGASSLESDTVKKPAKRSKSDNTSKADSTARVTAVTRQPSSSTKKSVRHSQSRPRAITPEDEDEDDEGRNAFHPPSSPRSFLSQSLSGNEEGNEEGEEEALSRAAIQFRMEKPVFLEPNNAADSSVTATSKKATSAAADLFLPDDDEEMTAQALKDDSGDEDEDEDGDGNGVVEEQDEDDGQDDDEEWPRYLQFKPKLGIKRQTPLVRMLIRRAIRIGHIIIVTEDGFAESQDREEFRSIVVMQAGDDLEKENPGSQQFQLMNQRVMDDGPWRQLIGEFAAERASIARSKMRSAALVHVTSYCFGEDEAGADRVAALLDDSVLLVFDCPVLIMTQVKWVITPHTVYQNPAIIKTIQRAWFKTPTAFGTKLNDFYVSSLEGSSDKEFPIPVIALAATTVYAALSMWSSGDFVDHDFSADAYKETYDRHVHFFEETKKTLPLAFHDIMSKIYKLVRDKQPSTQSAASKGNPFIYYQPATI